ncbi:MAG TPA: hypothetical protein VHA14_02285, partial [Bryobacteraceae bacterium]|nr:hypothetical protein [Bryobacteraceae bacterium]
MTRRELFGAVGQAGGASMALSYVVKSAILGVSEDSAEAADTPVVSSAGVDRINILGSRTYLHGWAGYGEAPVLGQPARRAEAPAAPAQAKPTGVWTKESGPGTVTFGDPRALITTATFSALGSYALKLTATDGQTTHSSTLHVSVEPPPPAKQLEAVYTRNFKISSPFWNARAKALIVNWIPHCIDQMNRQDLPLGEGGIDNFINAGKALRGEPHGYHKGYVFSNAWVHQTVEAMSIALMIDPQGDPEIIQAQQKFRKTLDEWIPIILAAQEPDGYLQTAFTAAPPRRAPLPPVPVTKPDGSVVLARVAVSQDPDGTLHANRIAARGGRGRNPGAEDEPFDGKTSTTVLFPVTNQDFTLTMVRIAITESAAPAGGGRGPNTVLTARRVEGANPDGKPDTKIEEPQSTPANLTHWDPATRGNHEGYTAGYFLES